METWSVESERCVCTRTASQSPVASLRSLGGIASQATHWHKDYGQWILLVLVALHILAILYYLLGKKKNLVRPMILGDKALPVGTPAAADSGATRLLALLVAALCAGGVGWVASLGG